jgi:hypothetical protein
LLYEKILSEISQSLLMQHTAEIAKWVRLSGSEEEAHALEYVKGVLRGYGYDVHEYSFDSFVGYPESAELTILSPDETTYAGVPPALAPPTPGICADLVYAGDARNLEGLDVSNKIVVFDGFSDPYLAKLAEKHGAVGEVFINDDHVHEGIVSVVWGTPTPETSHLLPKTPSINITASQGKQLVTRLKKDAVTARLKTTASCAWKKIPVMTGELKGEEDDFVLFSGHIDSWHYGAMDNAGANAAMLEIARVTSAHRDLLRRGVRLAFWSGHSHGRYSGSTWYADNFWEDLHQHCVTHVNIDSIGAKGASVLREAGVMAEARSFASSAVEQIAGQELTGARLTRAGDQSFWGLGIPSIFMELSEQPLRTDAKAPSFIFGPRSGGLGWWWHTREDTLDKIDPANLVRDTKIYLLIILGLCSSLILPFNYSATVHEIEQTLRDLQAAANQLFDLTPLIKRTEKLKELTMELKHQTVNFVNGENSGMAAKSSARKINETLKRLGRLLIPINYTRAGPFDQDLAVPIPMVPVLDRITDLSKLKSDSDEFRFLITRLRREANKVNHYLCEAEDTILKALKDMED